jgi:hypothetical protein
VTIHLISSYSSLSPPTQSLRQARRSDWQPRCQPCEPVSAHFALGQPRPRTSDRSLSSHGHYISLPVVGATTGATTVPRPPRANPSPAQSRDLPIYPTHPLSRTRLHHPTSIPYKPLLLVKHPRPPGKDTCHPPSPIYSSSSYLFQPPNRISHGVPILQRPIRPRNQRHSSSILVNR